MGWSDYMDLNDLKLSPTRDIFKALYDAINERFFACTTNNKVSETDLFPNLGYGVINNIESYLNELSLISGNSGGVYFFTNDTIDNLTLTEINAQSEMYFPCMLFSPPRISSRAEIAYSSSWVYNVAYTYDSYYMPKIVRYNEKLYATGHRWNTTNINKNPETEPLFWYEIKDRQYEGVLSSELILYIIDCLNKLCYPYRAFAVGGDYEYLFTSLVGMPKSGTYEMRLYGLKKGDAHYSLIYENKSVEMSLIDPYQTIPYPEEIADPTEYESSFYAQFKNLEFIAGS